MLKGINFKEFLNTYQEWHALVFGFCETMCPGEPRHPGMSDELAKQIEDESHYYRSGRVIGYIARVLFIAGVIIGMTVAITEVIF